MFFFMLSTSIDAYLYQKQKLLSLTTQAAEANEVPMINTAIRKTVHTDDDEHEAG